MEGEEVMGSWKRKEGKMECFNVRGSMMTLSTLMYLTAVKSGVRWTT